VSNLTKHKQDKQSDTPILPSSTIAPSVPQPPLPMTVNMTSGTVVNIDPSIVHYFQDPILKELADTRAKLKDAEERERQCEERYKKLVDECVEYKREISDLRDKVARLEAKIKKLSGLDTNVLKLQNQERIRRARLLMGSVAFNFMDRVLEVAFGVKDLKANREKYTTLKSIVDDVDDTKWQQIRKKFKIHSGKKFDKILKDLRSRRIGDAHPYCLTAEEELSLKPNTNPDQIQLKDGLKEESALLYNNRDSAEEAGVVAKLIESLFELSSHLGKPLLSIPKKTLIDSSDDESVEEY